MEIHGCSNYDSQKHLPKNFKLSGKALFVFLKYFDIIVNKANDSHPNGGEYEQYDIDIVQFGKQKHRYKGSQYDNQTAHSGCTGFFVLPFKTQVTNSFANLLFTEVIDNFLSKYYCNKQGKNNGQSRPE